MTDKKIRVLIVDDSSLIREMFSAMLSEDSEIEVVGTAVDVTDARQKIKDLNPDVVTLDIEMPGMDGITFLEKIMTLRPMPVIMCSTLTQKGTDETLKALELGAVDFIGKPFAKEDKDTLPFVKGQLISKVKIAAASKIQSFRTVSQDWAINAEKDKELMNTLQGVKDTIIAIGSSTGGVEAVKILLSNLPKKYMPPIVITQHMPETFTASFAKRLNSVLSMNIVEAKNSDELEPGGVYIAPGNLHMEVVRNSGKFYIQLKDGELCSGHKPSVDILFKSVANCGAKNMVGIILTGMGRDGAEGLLEMKQKGAYTVGQSEESCVVYGMPKIAKSLGAIEIELPVENMGEKVLEYIKGKMVK